MLWQAWLTSIAPVLGLTVGQAGIVLGMFFSGVSALAGGLISDENVVISMGIPSFLAILIFTYAEWLPIFTGAAIALIIGLVVARELSGGGG